MGQNNSAQNISSHDFSLVREVPNGAIVKQNNGRLHFVKEYTFTNQQAYQQAFVNFSKKLPEKHEHILYLERTNTKLQNTFCSTFFKISLLYQYLDHTLQKEIQKRIQERKVFDEKQVWSVLCSCTLAVSQMIRFQGRSHAALKTKDLRLTQEGVVKILSLQMVGMEPDQDASQQGTVKQLAITILNCILMDQISNNSQFFLNEIIDNLQSSDQMKNVLRLMMSPKIKFVQLQQYLFKLVQEDTDSLNSYSHTPIVKEKALKNNSYSKIPQQSKQDDNLFNMPRDIEDNPENKIPQYHTQEQEIPDQNDAVQDSKETLQESLRNTLREKNIYQDSIQKSQPFPRINQAQFGYKKNSQNLFTDPKLLNLIHYNLEEINKRKSIANSRKLANVQSKTHLQRRESKGQLHSQQNNKNYNQLKNQNSFIQQNTFFVNQQSNIMNQIINEDQNNQPLIQNSSIRSTTNKKQNQNISPVNREETKQSKSSSSIVIPNRNVQSEQLTFKSQKYVAEHQGNPQDKKMKIQEDRYDNIMDIKDMGFKKNKNTKITQEIRQSKEPKQIMHHVYHNNQSFSSQNNSNNNSFNYNNLFEQNSHSESNVVPLSNSLANTSKSNKNNIMYSMNQSKEEFEYVTQTYLRGKYQGTKLNNMRHGTGVFYYIEGGKYIGQWKQNKMNGKGVLYYPDNSIAYDGQWKDDQLSGYGTLYNEEVTQLKGPFDYKTWRDIDLYFVKYQGQFKEDSKNGKGKLFLSNGQIFEGHFKDDMIWGQGMLLKQDGSKMRGIWRQNKLMKLF